MMFKGTKPNASISTRLFSTDINLYNTCILSCTNVATIDLSGFWNNATGKNITVSLVCGYPFSQFLSNIAKFQSHYIYIRKEVNRPNTVVFSLLSAVPLFMASNYCITLKKVYSMIETAVANSQVVANTGVTTQDIANCLYCYCYIQRD